MSPPILEVRNLSKRYRLGQIGVRSLREEVESLFSKIRNQRPEEGTSRDFWALKDVSFEVQRGEVLGIIGRNGAGKSTLLKILSRITEPTTGEAVLRGRVASLLEVGTGFHPELTGRENVYLNGTILGMKKREIDARFDEIVDFAEMGPFIDTPVKRYSSGQSVRLGFAVAAHLEAEILVIDEVLAVGDLAFQRKCVQQLKSDKTQDRTVLVVSHQMPTVLRLCNRAIWMEAGEVHETGDACSVVQKYQSSLLGASDLGGKVELEHCPREGGVGSVRFVWGRLSREDGGSQGFEAGAPLLLEVEIEANRPARHFELGYSVKRDSGEVLYTASSLDSPENDDWSLSVGRHRFHTRMSPNFLRPGRYYIQLGITCEQLEDLIGEAIVFDILASPGASRNRIQSLPGSFSFPYIWTRGEAGR